MKSFYYENILNSLKKRLQASTNEVEKLKITIVNCSEENFNLNKKIEELTTLLKESTNTNEVKEKKIYDMEQEIEYLSTENTEKRQYITKLYHDLKSKLDPQQRKSIQSEFTRLKIRINCTFAS